MRDVIERRGIEEVVHFTTNKGLTGVLFCKYLKARSLLAEEDSLQFIMKNNAPYRSDEDWLEYVNLSITKINTSFFSCCKNWHDNSIEYWCVLCFSSDILLHEGVVFTTTNNIYPSVVRGEGVDGLEAIFAEKVYGKYGYEILRDHRPDNLPTDIQAEVLYPEELSLDFLNKIVVSSEDAKDQVFGLLSALDMEDIEVEVDETVFN